MEQNWETHNPLTHMRICSNPEAWEKKYPNCRPCRFFIDGHCTTDAGKHARAIIEAKDKV